MSLLSIAQDMSSIVAIQAPTAILSNLTDDNRKIVRFTTDAAEELARRVDWAALRATTTITGTGANDDFSLPGGFSRLIDGNSIKSSTGPVRAGLSEDEWNSLTPVEGVPRYARLLGSSVSFYPYLALGATATVTYQSENWCPSGTALGTDAEEALVPEDLIRMGAIWRWRRHLGQDIQDFLAEYESALADRAKFDGGIRSP